MLYMNILYVYIYKYIHIIYSYTTLLLSWQSGGIPVITVAAERTGKATAPRRGGAAKPELFQCAWDMFVASRNRRRPELFQGA